MRSVLLGTAALLAVLVAPVQAGPPAGSHDLPFGGCWWFVVQPLGPTDPASTRYVGEIDCEAVWLTRNHDAGPTTTHATVTFTLQTDSDPGGGGVVASCTFTSVAVGFVVVGACPLSFDMPSDRLWWCTRYTWSEATTGSFAYTLDFDPVAPGSQCSTHSE